MDDAKRLYLVVGPESSGTKFLTRLFLQAGCHGDSGHQQRWDNEMPTVTPVVYRRSYPHGREWPDLQTIIDRFDEYEVRLIVVIRSMQFTTASRRRHAGGDVEGRSVQAIQMISQQWSETAVSGVWVTYEALVKYSEATLRWLFDWCELSCPRGVKIKDGNKQYAK